MKSLEFRIKKEQLKAVRCLSRFSILNSQVLLCFVLAMFCSIATADSLKFKFTLGDKYSLVSVTEEKMSQLVDSNERTMEQTRRLECDFEVQEVDESGTAWAKYTYRRFTMKIRVPGQKIDYDSDSNQLKIPMQAIPLQMVMGESLYLQITSQGRIEKINGLPSLITYAKGKLGNFQGADIASRSIEQQFDEPDVRRKLEDQLAVFPDSNQGGPRWSRVEIFSSTDLGYLKREQTEDVNIVSERTFRLNPEKSGRGGIAVVDVNLVMKPAPASIVSVPTSEQDTAMSVKASREISGEGAGQIEIEEATGRIINYTMAQDTAENVKLTSQGPMLRPPPSPQPIISHIVTTFQMTKVEGAKPAQPAAPPQGEVSPPADANKKGI